MRPVDAGLRSARRFGEVVLVNEFRTGLGGQRAPEAAQRGKDDWLF
jgi:hypothetical protein